MRGADHPMKPCRIERGRAARDEGTNPKVTPESARGDARCVIQSSERVGPFNEGRDEPSGQGTFRDNQDPNRIARLRQAGRIKRFFESPRGPLGADPVRGAFSLQNKSFLEENEALERRERGRISGVDRGADGGSTDLLGAWRGRVVDADRRGPGPDRSYGVGVTAPEFQTMTPLTIVNTLCVAGIAGGGAWKMSCESTARSAS